MGLPVDGKLTRKDAEYGHWVTSDGPPGLQVVAAALMLR